MILYTILSGPSLLFQLGLGVARSSFLDRFKHCDFLKSNSKNEIIFLESAGFGATGSCARSAGGLGVVWMCGEVDHSSVLYTKFTR